MGMTETSSINFRKALKSDAEQIAVITRKAREAAMSYLPKLYTPEEYIKFFRDDVLENCEVWIAESEKILGFCAFKKGWVDHLYISPEYQGQGIGKRLLMKAMEDNERLQLWTFQKNVAARSFYERQGFTLLKVTDGKDNEEKEPDVLYQWIRDQAILSLIGNDCNLLIETESLILEPTVEKHASLLFPLLQDESLYRYIPHDPPSLESLQKRYKAWSARKSPDGQEIWLNWMARHGATGDYIGHFQSGFDEKNGFTVAYTLGKPYQKQGYATEGLRGVINFLHAKMNARNIKAWIDTRNEPSIRLVKRLGFEQVQFIKNADEFKGSVSDEFVFELRMRS